MKFKELNTGQTFEFANTLSGAERGPWMKISKRKYSPSDLGHRLNGHEIEVGTLNVEVIPSTR
jgi:hypothetical protein